MPGPSEKKSSSSPLLKWHSEIMRHLISQLESTIENKKVTQPMLERIVETIFIDQTRAPWPGSLLSKEKKDSWRVFIEKNAKIFLYTSGSAAIREFASKASSQILRELSAAQLTETLISHDVVRNTKIEHMIRQEFYANGSAENTVSRSVQRYFREDARTRKTQTEIKSTENDPLRDLLGLPRIGRSLLPYEDIRVHMARFLKSAPGKIDDALGKIFADSCKPVGFADRQKTILLVDVRSSLAAQELSLSKPAYLAKLKQMPGFENLLDISFRVNPSKKR